MRLGWTGTGTRSLRPERVLAISKTAQPLFRPPVALVLGRDEQVAIEAEKEPGAQPDKVAGPAGDLTGGYIAVPRHERGDDSDQSGAVGVRVITGVQQRDRRPVGD